MSTLYLSTAEVVLQKMDEMEQMRRCQRCWEDVEVQMTEQILRQVAIFVEYFTEGSNFVVILIELK